MPLKKSVSRRIVSDSDSNPSPTITTRKGSKHQIEKPDETSSVAKINHVRKSSQKLPALGD
jgi:hypothetical protein